MKVNIVYCFRLCGTKLGCGEGGCGACTVMVSRVNREGGKVEHLSINACLAPVASMHGGVTVAVYTHCSVYHRMIHDIY